MRQAAKQREPQAEITLQTSLDKFSRVRLRISAHKEIAGGKFATIRDRLAQEKLARKCDDANPYPATQRDGGFLIACRLRANAALIVLFGCSEPGD